MNRLLVAIFFALSIAEPALGQAKKTQPAKPSVKPPAAKQSPIEELARMVKATIKMAQDEINGQDELFKAQLLGKRGYNPVASQIGLTIPEQGVFGDRVTPKSLKDEGRLSGWPDFFPSKPIDVLMERWRKPVTLPKG